MFFEALDRGLAELKSSGLIETVPVDDSLPVLASHDNMTSASHHDQSEVSHANDCDHMLTDSLPGALPDKTAAAVVVIIRVFKDYGLR